MKTRNKIIRRQNALAVLGDLYGMLGEEAGAELVSALKRVRKWKNGSLSAVRNPLKVP